MLPRRPPVRVRDAALPARDVAQWQEPRRQLEGREHEARACQLLALALRVQDRRSDRRGAA